MPYAALGVPLWLALHQSGVHATLAGIALAMTIPARPSFTPTQFEARIGELHAAFRADRRDAATTADPLTNERMASVAESMERSSVLVQSPLQRIEHALTPWVAFGVIPVFALSNAGIDLLAVQWREALSSRVTLGVLAGLVLGKFAGVSLFCWLAVRLGLARLPAGVAWKHLLGSALSAAAGLAWLYVAGISGSRPPS